MKCHGLGDFSITKQNICKYMCKGMYLIAYLSICLFGSVIYFIV
jgi:hypothetical protein